MAADPQPLAQAISYWPALVIGGKPIDCSHLNPVQISCVCPKVPRPVTVGVTYSNHCFTDHFQHGIHDPAWMVMDRGTERVFCFTRHTLSFKLPVMLQALPDSNVWQTKTDRNFVYAIMIDDGLGTKYPMFFTLKKSKGSGADLAMFIESAYPIGGDEMAEQLREAPKVKFATLCYKAFRNESLNMRLRG